MIVGEQQFLAESKGNAGQIICHIEPEIWAEVDETLYIRMMINLLSNALRYGEGRDIEVSLSVHNDSDIIGKSKRSWHRHFKGGYSSYMGTVLSCG